MTESRRGVQFLVPGLLWLLHAQCCGVGAAEASAATEEWQPPIARINAKFLAAYAEEASSEEGSGGGSAGFVLAFVGGFLQAWGALVASLSQLKVHEKLISERMACFWQVISGLLLLVAGTCVNFSYQSGGSVPVLSVVVSSASLITNMLTQIAFKVSTYNKVMRVGTLLFVVASIQLIELAPPKSDGQFLWKCFQPMALLWWVFYAGLWFVTAMTVWTTTELKKTNPKKVMAWALCASCFGGFQDTWSNINSTFSGTEYLISFNLSNVFGIVFLVFTVIAMSNCDVAIYLPAVTCFQLILNSVTDLAVWGALERIAEPVPYFTCYFIILLAIYLMNHEADLGATISIFRELRSGKLSQGFGATRFGNSLIALQQDWASQKNETLGQSMIFHQSSLNSVYYALIEAWNERIFSQIKLVELMLTLWHKQSPLFRPTEGLVLWLGQTDYFSSYIEKDPEFAKKLEQVLWK